MKLARKMNGRKLVRMKRINKCRRDELLETVVLSTRIVGGRELK